MLIRPVTRSDLPAVSEIIHVSMKDDELYTWIYPYQEKYPEDLQRAQMIRLRTRFVSPGSYGFVSVTEPDDEGWSGTPEVTGAFFWMRKGDDEAGKKWKEDSLGKQLERYLLSWETFYETSLLQRAASPTRHADYAVKKAMKFYRHLPSRWHLGPLAISPKFQRKGIGAKLLKHGLDIAAEESVPVALESSAVGQFLYMKAGFRIVEEALVNKEYNAAGMVWEPEGCKGVWLEDKGGGRAVVKVKR